MTEVLGMKIEVLSQELKFIREFDAPRELVWKAWTDPNMLAEWWGPHGFTNPVCEVDLRVGGKMVITMKGPDGKEYPVIGTYREIVRPEKLVWIDDVGDGDAWGENGPPPTNEVTTLFEDQGGKTKLTLISRFKSNADRDAIMKMGAAEGWAQSFERLALLVTKK